MRGRAHEASRGGGGGQPGRHPRDGDAPPRSGVGTDTPPDPAEADRRNGGRADPSATVYPAQRGRDDTWPPTTHPPDAGPGGSVPPDARRGDGGAGGSPYPRQRSVPAAPPPDGAPAGGPASPAAEGGSGPAPEVTGPVRAAGGTAVGEIDAVDSPAPEALDAEAVDRPGDAPAEVDADVDAEVADAVDGMDLDAHAAEGWALVRASQTGDTQAFGRLFDRYHDVVFRFVLFRLGDRTVAEDLTQETFVRAFRRITSVSYQGRDIGAWFVTIARNLVLDHVKSSRYRLEQAHPEVTDVAPGSTRPSPEHEVIAGATSSELLRCVARLGDDQQECVTLRFLQGLSVSETAQIMGRNEGAVKALQHRAVRRLGQLLPEGLR